MKKIAIILFCMVNINLSFGQSPQVPDVLKTVSELKDQFNDNIEIDESGNIITLISVRGDQTTFQNVLVKFRGKQTVENTFVLSGYKDALPGFSEKQKEDHLQQGLSSDQALSKGSYSLYLDLRSEVMEMLNLKQFSIIKLRKDSGKIEVEDFGDDRIKFINAIKIYFK